jgi:hypothetical protein
MSRFQRLPEHVEKHLGRVRGAEPSQTDEPDRGYLLVYCDHADGRHVSVLTSGLRMRTAGAPLPQELVCTLRADQERHARHLTAVIAALLTESKSRVGYGALIMNDRPLLPATEISGALAAPHPYLDDGFDTVLDAGGNPVLQIITLIPISRGEAQLVARFGSDVLYDRWEQASSDLADVHRASVA